MLRENSIDLVSACPDADVDVMVHFPNRYRVERDERSRWWCRPRWKTRNCCMFEQTVMLLLAGEFVCQVSHQKNFDISRTTNTAERSTQVCREDLSPVGGHLASIRLLSRLCPLREDERTAIRAYFAEIKSRSGAGDRIFTRSCVQLDRRPVDAWRYSRNQHDHGTDSSQDADLRNELQMVAAQFKTISADGSHRSVFERCSSE